MVVVHGDVSPGYEAVAEAFRGTGAAMARSVPLWQSAVDSQVVVDLSGGSANPRPGRLPGSGAYFGQSVLNHEGRVCARRRARALWGLFEYDEPVAAYWPQGRGRREATRSCAHAVLAPGGGCARSTHPVSVATLADADAVAAAIGHQKPAWTPGERHGYHAVTLGWYESELIRTHRPTAADQWPVLPRRSQRRSGWTCTSGCPTTSPRSAWLGSSRPLLVPREDGVSHAYDAETVDVTNFLNPRSITARSFANPKLVGEALRYNDREIRRLELPSTTGPGRRAASPPPTASSPPGAAGWGSTR